MEKCRGDDFMEMKHHLYWLKHHPNLEDSLKEAREKRTTKIMNFKDPQTDQK